MIPKSGFSSLAPIKTNASLQPLNGFVEHAVVHMEIDRIRSGIVTEDFIASRADARGIDAADYMSGNILQKEVEAKHVAEAFLMLAQMARTTGHIVTVDGGNIEASLR